MRLRASACELLRAPSAETEPFAVVSARPMVPRGAAVSCPDGHAKPLHRCSSCAQFLRELPSGDRTGLTITCVFLDTDPVDRVMTPADRIIVLPETRSLEAAAAQARRHEIHASLVCDGDEIIGWATRRDIARRASLRPLEPMATVTRRPIPVVTHGTPLGTMVAILRRPGCSTVFVVDGHLVVGLVTRENLRRIGLTRNAACTVPGHG